MCLVHLLRELEKVDKTNPASEKGANTQAILMSIYRTRNLRGLGPIETIADALAMFIASGRLPSLPAAKPPG